VRRVGVSNVNRMQLDEALELAPISAVQVALSLFDDRALRGGVVERCEAAGIEVIAHSPLGGPRRARSLARDQVLGEIAQAHRATPAEVALAWLLGLSPVVLPIPGARRPESVRSAARAAELDLSEDDRTVLDRAFGASRAAPPRPRGRRRGDVVVVMGIPGAGKTRAAEKYVARGYVRLNRDERGGSLRELAGALDESLASGANRVVLDNTYLTRAARSYVIDVAQRHGAPARCVWIEVPLAQAQVNLIGRLLDRFGSLPEPDELRRLARAEAGVHTPTTHMRTLRDLEPPSSDEGFAAIEQVAFARAPGNGRPGVFVATTVLQTEDWREVIATADTDAPHLLFDWRPDASVDSLAPEASRLRSIVSGHVEAALCPHGGGAPTCWCRPPLPGLPLAFAHRHGVDPLQSILIGTSTAHRTLATTLGARHVAA
jgi:predicted kinase